MMGSGVQGFRASLVAAVPSLLSILNVSILSLNLL